MFISTKNAHPKRRLKHVFGFKKNDIFKKEIITYLNFMYSYLLNKHVYFVIDKTFKVHYFLPHLGIKNKY